MNAVTKRILTCMMAVMLLISVMPVLASPAYASDGKNRTVRVGFFAYPGYHEFDGSLRSGYGADFLRLLQRYTDFRYVYTGYENSWEEMQQMLLNGEIDLVTSARKTPEREEQYDFSEPIGESYAQINVRADDTRFLAGDYSALNGIKIGIIAGNSRNADLKRFAEEKNLTFLTIEFRNAEELETALQANRVDAVATSSLRKTTGEKTVAEFAPESFYVIVRKGNTELLDEINYGINQMDVNEGNWRDDLRYQNYGRTMSNSLEFTPRELAYIEAVQSGKTTITVSAQPDRDPYSYVENGKLVGIIPDYFAHLMEMAGLPYTLLAPKDRDEYQLWTQTNHTDIILDCRYGSSPSAELDFGLVTDSYMEVTTSRVTRKGFDGDIRKIAATDSQKAGLAGEETDGDVEYLTVPTGVDAMQAVKDGRADACYVETYTADKFISADPDNVLHSTVLKQQVYREYFYISPDSDHELCSILNKCIKTDASSALDTYVRNYTMATYERLSFMQYLKRNPSVVFVIAGVPFILLILIAVMLFRSRTAKLKAAQYEREIADQKKLEESLTFTNYFLNAYTSAYYVDLDTGAVKVYKRPESELGKRSVDETDYQKSFVTFFREAVHPEDAEELISLIRPEKIRELIGQGEFSYSYRDLSAGDERVMRMQIIRGADDAHAVFGFADITEEYREQQKRLLGAMPLSSDVLSKANIGMWAFELDEGQPPRMYDDETMLGLVGLEHQVPPEEAYHAWYDHIDEDSYDLVTDAVNKMISGEHAEVQYPWHYPDGRTIIVRCGGVRNYEYTKGIRIEGTHQDVTQTLHFDEEQRRREEQQRQDEIARIKAESSDKAKTEFLFNMSHDIRTPMNAILGYTDIALNHTDEPERVQDSLQKIKTSGSHLLNLINDILEMSRIEAGRMEIVDVPLNIYRVTEGVVNMSQALAATKDITFRAEIGELSNPYIYSDELHTNQVIINLISNAIKYTPSGGTVDYRIEQISAPVREIATYRVVVKDNGIGMSDEFQTHLFESFSRERTSTVSKQEGAGLGLAIVKRIVDLMGGSIRVSSRQGEGSTFVVELPLKVMDAAAIEAFEAANTGDVGTASDLSLAGKKALLVEDNEMNREIATEILEAHSLVVDRAEDGAIAVRKVMENGVRYYDFILMDVQMPVMNGYEATTEIRKLPGGDRIPIIALSANAFREDIDKSLAAGMNAHVAKPINIKELLGTLAKFLP